MRKVAQSWDFNVAVVLEDVVAVVVVVAAAAAAVDVSLPADFRLAKDGHGEKVVQAWRSALLKESLLHLSEKVVELYPFIQKMFDYT